jgi:hypothetical protein
MRWASPRFSRKARRRRRRRRCSRAWAESGVALGLDGSFPLAPELVLGPETQGLRGQRLAPRPELPVPDHVPGNAECVASFMDAAQRHVDVRVPRVVVVDRYPLELRPELVLEGVHEPSGVVSQVQGMGVLGRDDELEEPLVSGPLPGAELIRDRDPAVLVAIEARPAPALPLGSLLGKRPWARHPPLLRLAT